MDDYKRPKWRKYLADPEPTTVAKFFAGVAVLGFFGLSLLIPSVRGALYQLSVMIPLAVLAGLIGLAVLARKYQWWQKFQAIPSGQKANRFLLGLLVVFILGALLNTWMLTVGTNRPFMPTFFRHFIWVPGVYVTTFVLGIVMVVAVEAAAGHKWASRAGLVFIVAWLVGLFVSPHSVAIQNLFINVEWSGGTGMFLFGLCSVLLVATVVFLVRHFGWLKAPRWWQTRDTTQRLFLVGLVLVPLGLLASVVGVVYNLPQLHFWTWQLPTISRTTWAWIIVVLGLVAIYWLMKGFTKSTKGALASVGVALLIVGLTWAWKHDKLPSMPNMPELALFSGGDEEPSPASGDISLTTRTDRKAGKAEAKAEAPPPPPEEPPEEPPAEVVAEAAPEPPPDESPPVTKDEPPPRPHKAKVRVVTSSSTGTSRSFTPARVQPNASVTNGWSDPKPVPRQPSVFKHVPSAEAVQLWESTQPGTSAFRHVPPAEALKSWGD